MEKLDEYTRTQIPFPSKDGKVLLNVTYRRRNPSGALIGTKYDSSVLYSRVYMVKLLDGNVEEYSTNMLAEALTSLNDTEGYDTCFIPEMCGY